MTPAPRRCPACDVPPVPGLRLAAGQRLRRCPCCGTCWWDWPRIEPAAFYDRDYFQSAEVEKGYDDYAALEPSLRRTARGRLASIARWQRTAGRLLDVGCGTGTFLEAARAAGWAVRGIEVSAYAAEQARRRGLEVECGTVESAAALSAQFDLITLWDVIEHLGDPRGALTALAAALRPGGLLVLSTGDVTSLCARISGPRWHLYTLPEHLFFYSPAGLRRLLERAGLTPLALRHDVTWFTVGYLWERLSKSLLRRRAGSLPVGVARLSVPATLLDVITVVGRQGVAASPAATHP